MDREILFRGKRMDNGKWVQGWYCPKKTGHYESDRLVEEMQSIIIASMTGGGYQYAVVSPETVCQYTGLADRKGKKIFVGDILTIPYSKKQGLPAEVRYNVRSGAYEIRRNGYKPISLADADEWCEVVGNAFDNPELWKEVLNESDTGDGDAGELLRVSAASGCVRRGNGYLLWM